MKLLAEVNKAADDFVDSQTNITLNLEKLSNLRGLDIEQINETVTTFLTTYARKAADGELTNPKVKENVINIFAAIRALSQPDLASAFNDNENLPLGQVLDDFYGKSGKEAHTLAANRLNEIGKHRSVATYRQQAEEAVNNSGRITEFAQKIRTAIEPIMNQLLSQERRQAQGRLDKESEAKKAETMGRPMQGMVPGAAKA